MDKIVQCPKCQCRRGIKKDERIEVTEYKCHCGWKWVAPAAGVPHETK